MNQLDNEDPITRELSYDSNLSPVSTYSDRSSDYSDDNNIDHELSNLTQEELTSQISNISTLSKDRRNQIEEAITHYENMDKGITRMPQFYKADEFLKCLSQFTIENESLKDLEKLAIDQNLNESSVRYEVIIENQRGATILGIKLYSGQSVLYPLDPPKYQTLTGKNLTNLSMYPEPANNWKWCWKKWHVMMINDVDDEGWIYSKVRFGSYKWSGVGRFGDFVRRRIWLRMVERVHTEKDYLSETSTANNSESGSDIEETIWVSPSFKDISLPHDATIGHIKKKIKKKLGSNNRQMSRSSQSKKSISTLLDEDKNSEDDDFETDEQESVIPFSRELFGDNKNDVNESDSNSDYSIEPFTNDPTELDLIKQAYNKLKCCTIDRERINCLLDLLFEFNHQTLLYLLRNYETKSDKLDSWIAKLLKKIHFHDSRSIFINKFKSRLDSSTPNTQRKYILEKLYPIFIDLLENSLYNSEKS